MTNRRPIPIASPSWRRTRAHSEWNVPAWTSRPPSPTRLMIRSRSSAAARLVNVTARIRHGGDVLDADEVGDPVGQDPGLARAGAGQDEQRALGGRDGARLLGVERPDDLLGALLARGAATTAGSGGRRPGRPGRRRDRGASRSQAGSSGGDRRPRRGRRRPSRPCPRPSPRRRRASGRRSGDDGWGSPPHCRSGGSPGSRATAGRAQAAALTWSAGGAAIETGSSQRESDRVERRAVRRRRS